MKLTLLLVPLVFFMTSCTIDWNIEKGKKNTELEKPYTSSGETIKSLGSGFAITESGNVASVFYDKRLILKTGNEISPPTILSITGTTQFILIREYLSEANKDTIFDMKKGEVVDILGRYPVLNNIFMNSSGTLVLENQGFDGGGQIIEYDPIRNLIVSNGKILLEGFNLSQTDDETMLSYSGKTIKTWSHIPPENVPFIWDEACIDFFEAMDSINPEEREKNEHWKQDVWEKFDITSKKNCMKEYLNKSINIESTNDGRFYRISQSYYESYDSWLFDTKTGNIQKLPNTSDQIEITENEVDIEIKIKNERGEIGGYELYYDTDFNKLLRKKELPY